MSFTEIFNFKNIRTVILLMFITLAISLIASFIQVPKYHATAKLIVILGGNNVDSFTAARNSYLTGIITEVVPSNSFIEQVMIINPNLAENFSSDSEERLRQWKKTVKVKAQDTKGVIFLDVWYPQQNQAQQLVQAVTDTILTKHGSYHGANNVSLRVIDYPIVSSQWAEPNILRNVGVGLVVGFLLGLTFIIIFPEQRLLEYIFNRRSFYGDETLTLAPTSSESATLATTSPNIPSPIKPEAGLSSNLPATETKAVTDSNQRQPQPVSELIPKSLWENRSR